MTRLAAEQVLKQSRPRLLAGQAAFYEGRHEGAYAHS